MTDPDTVEQLIVLLDTARAALLKDEHDALVEKIGTALRRAFAERDGWRSIAEALLEVATGAKPGDFTIPPVELIELRSVGSLRTQIVPALEQFWRDTVRRHTPKPFKPFIPFVMPIHPAISDVAALRGAGVAVFDILDADRRAVELAAPAAPELNQRRKRRRRKRKQRRQ